MVTLADPMLIIVINSTVGFILYHNDHKFWQPTN